MVIIKINCDANISHTLQRPVLSCHLISFPKPETNANPSLLDTCLRVEYSFYETLFLIKFDKNSLPK